ncbi:MAG TPA: biopolymer transporter ExbD [Tepidisphaeraceae bacterium]|nr:biopolymer transporter ExbD [Tepidisphaeraceae bacterium]
MPEMKEGGVNVTPLIDIVMCLIIFFILVAKIGVSTGIDSSIKNPESYLGVKISDMGNVLALNLYKKGVGDEPQVVVNLPGRPKTDVPIMVGEPGSPNKRFPLQELLTEIKKVKGEAFKVVINAGTTTTPSTDAAGNPLPPNPDGTPAVNTNELEYAQVSIVLQQCAQAGVTNVHFAMKKGTKELHAR